MREQWNHLSLHDKRTACIGILAILIALLYVLIWQPLINTNDTLRNQIQHNQNLLIWMKSAAKQLEELQQYSQPLSTEHSNASALSLVQDAVKNSPFSGKFSQLKQADMDSVLLNLQAVNFDDLITWLTNVGQNHGLIISQISITPVGAAGVVNADMNMQKKSN